MDPGCSPATVDGTLLFALAGVRRRRCAVVVRPLGAAQPGGSGERRARRARACRARRARACRACRARARRAGAAGKWSAAMGTAASLGSRSWAGDIS